MSFMDFLFGGTDDSGQQAQINSNERIAAQIRDDAQTAAGDIKKLFPNSERTFANGAGQAFDLVGDSTVQQLSAVQQGANNAQNTLLAGARGHRDAILGNQGDWSAEAMAGFSQPINLDLSFLNRNGFDHLFSDQLGLSQGTQANQGFGQSFGSPNFDEQGFNELINSTISNYFPTNNQPPATASTNSPYGQFSSAVADFQNGVTDIGQGTRNVISQARASGMNANQVAQQLGLTEEEVINLANQYAGGF